MKLEVQHTDATRYSKSEIDIYCRNCKANLGDIVHICSARLVTRCKNCGELCEIETQAQVRGI